MLEEKADSLFIKKSFDGWSKTRVAMKIANSLRARYERFRKTNLMRSTFFEFVLMVKHLST